MANETDGIRRQLEYALAPYGYYLVPGEDHRDLHFTGAEVALPALALLTWALKEYLKTVLAELGKSSVGKLMASRKLDERELTQQLSDIQKELREIRAQLATPERMLQMTAGCSPG